MSEETMLLAAILSDADVKFKHRNADVLIERLQNGVSRGTLDLLDGTLKKDVWIGQRDKGIREKLQTIGILVDLGILNNPRPFERRFSAGANTGKNWRQDSGSWHNTVRRLRFG